MSVFLLHVAWLRCILSFAHPVIRPRRDSSSIQPSQVSPQLYPLRTTQYNTTITSPEWRAVVLLTVVLQKTRRNSVLAGS
ncbi:hypothetical protein BDR04DRAFT_1091391, partial [Suillus decipiens]